MSDNKPIKPIEWTEQLSVGVPQIDEDHRALMSLANRCIAELNHDQQNDKEIRNILDELLNYTQYHFQREELLMKVCEYPNLIKHQKVHQLLIREVVQNTREYYLGNITVKNLLEFITDWLTNHIMCMDKAIAPYCKDKTSLIEHALKAIEINKHTTNRKL